MALKRSEQALFAREAIRTFQPDHPPRLVEASVLNPHARRIAEQFNKNVLSPRLLSGLFGLGEFAALGAIALGVLASYGRLSDALLALPLVGLAIATLALLHGYEPSQLRSQRRQPARVALALLAGIVATLPCAAWAGSLDASLGACLLTYAAVSMGALTLARRVLAHRIRHWSRTGRLERRVVLVGGGGAAEQFIRQLDAVPDSDIRICGIFDDRDGDRSPPLVAGYPKLGTVAELTEFARIAKIDMLVVTLPLSAEKRILTILKSLWVLPLDIRISALSQNLRFRSRSYSYMGDVPMLDVMDRPIADWNQVAKRGFDLVFGIAALVAVAPIMILTAIAIKLDTPGPVFFRQKRHGFNNEEILVWKFRSLRHDMADPTARKLVTKGDPRVTRVGRFIRRSSIDELPQLFNVLIGNLSLVGPRPHAVHAQSSTQVTFTEIVDGYFGRHKVKPGITGYAQLKGWRGEIDDDVKLQKRFEHDLFYIENWSLLLDLYILFATPYSLLNPKGAY
ncbi:undecaprenyl-phosphate glucose phosphotransferase [Aureimonas sp. Leaf324]|jgi:Undecaprenyl-phosphate glucose phosphotransferase|uniref:undecaprenyl-phosphate glucose phosphotransferase n=1 Tax=Aureimonas sp. Leaf324 TaxID=1736336 RepID=UPI0007014BC9|nr:undecaprenyl-phosphate glucose phosphotransferase [Aureimonas sp. Leaf324]KQQ85598.1 undecaprenyl-phosphate glucose phosphotransferase [Aureimonas sp. Leaf324]